MLDLTLSEVDILDRSSSESMSESLVESYSSERNSSDGVTRMIRELERNQLDQIKAMGRKLLYLSGSIKRLKYLVYTFLSIVLSTKCN